MRTMAPIDRKNMEYLPVSGRQLKAVDDELGTVAGHLAVFNNIDLGADKVLPNAFKSTIREAEAQRAKSGDQMLWPLMWNHSAETPPIGMITSAKEDSYGLAIQAKLDLGNSLARDIYSGFKFGSIKSFSIGYRAQDTEFVHDKDSGKTIRLLKSISLVEGSVVNFPMNPLARVSQVKRLWPGYSFEAEAEAEAKEGRVLSARTMSVLRKASSGIESHVQAIQAHMNAVAQNDLAGYPVYGNASSDETYEIASLTAELEELNAALEGKEGRSISEANRVKIAYATDGIMKHVKVLKSVVNEAARYNQSIGVTLFSSDETYEEKEAEDDPLVVSLREIRQSLTSSERSVESQLEELGAKIGVDLALAAFLASED